MFITFHFFKLYSIFNSWPQDVWLRKSRKIIDDFFYGKQYLNAAFKCIASGISETFYIKKCYLTCGKYSEVYLKVKDKADEKPNMLIISIVSLFRFPFLLLITPETLEKKDFGNNLGLFVAFCKQQKVLNYSRYKYPDINKALIAECVIC